MPSTAPAKTTARQLSFFRCGLLLTSTAIACLLAACSSKPAATETAEKPAEEVVAPSWFEDITEASGLNFVHDAGPTGTFFMPQSMGSGAAAFDFDGDGLLDIYLLNFGGPNSKSVNRLYRQTSPGKFVDVTDGSGLGIPGHNHGVAIGDINNDGKPDVLVSQFGGIKLFLNLGNGKFADITTEAGLANLSWGASAAFLDYDRDGWLDLVVVNYLDFDPKVQCRSPDGVLDFCGPNTFKGTASKLFRNRGLLPGEAGKPFKVGFEDASFASGIGRVTGPGLGVTACDFDGDGWPDIFVANDGQPNRLWINKKDGTFADEAVSRGVAFTVMGKAFAGMGIAIGDTNNDGMVDLYVTHLGIETNNLWRQSPRGQFRDRTVEAGLSTTKWRGTGFGTLMADFNNDGALDIAVVNGKVFRGGPAKNTDLGFWETYAEQNQIFANDGTGNFRDVSAGNKPFSTTWNVARGLVCADFDNDGAPDLLVTTLGGHARLYRNVVADRGHWAKVRAFDPKWNRDVYGAEIRVRAGGKEFIRIVNPAESYLCSGPAIPHFGLGAATAIEWIQVTWPEGDKGVKEVFPGGPADRALTVRRGEGKSP